MAIAYVQFRRAPTNDEIRACRDLMAKAGYHDYAAGVQSNLDDETLEKPEEGKFAHDHLFSSGTAEASRILDLPFLNPEAFSKAEQILPYKHAIKQAKYESGIDASTVAAYERSVKAIHVPRRSRTLASLLPKEAYRYRDATKTLITKEAGPKDPRLEDLCAASMRLGLRESASAKTDGVVAILGTIYGAHKGHFTQKEYHGYDKIRPDGTTEHIPGIREFVSVHIGATGVEDEHQKQANAMAVAFVEKMLTEGKVKELAAVFRQETKLVDERTELAGMFVDAMKKAAQIDAVPGVLPIVMKPRENLKDLSARPSQRQIKSDRWAAVAKANAAQPQHTSAQHQQTLAVPSETHAWRISLAGLQPDALADRIDATKERWRVAARRKLLDVASKTLVREALEEGTGR